MIDINCDMGEFHEAIEDGSQEAIMPFLTSVNIACGGHAGDEWTMRTTVEQARRHRLTIGAHPGYPDPANFGRIAITMEREALERTVCEQVRTLAEIAPEIAHVKAHGALYNLAARDRAVAASIARGVARFNNNVILVGLAGSLMLDEFRDAGFCVAAEAFADRRYEADGSLRARSFANALIADPEEAAEQALRFARSGRVQTVCIHGDSPGAREIAEAVWKALREK